MAVVLLNGRLLPEEEALLPINDRAVLFGDGAYETMRSYTKTFFRFPEHLRRLHHTLRGMSLELPYSDEQITRGAHDLLAANGIESARLRLTVTGGRHDGQIRLRRAHPPNLILTAEPLTPPPAAAYADGVAVVLAEWPVHSHSPLPRIKTVTRLMHLMAKEEALARGAWEAIFLDENGGVLEGTATNVFFVLDGELRTAGLDGPLLAGVTRDAALEVARRQGLAVREQCVAKEDLARVEEAFLTSTTIEILPIREIDGRRVGDGRPGPVWRRLIEGYRSLVSEETGVPLAPLP
jgi:D-amino acid aminotransferase